MLRGVDALVFQTASVMIYPAEHQVVLHTPDLGILQLEHTQSRKTALVSDIAGHVATSKICWLMEMVVSSPTMRRYRVGSLTHL